jgi:hypothetical protein
VTFAVREAKLFRVPGHGIINVQLDAPTLLSASIQATKPWVGLQRRLPVVENQAEAKHVESLCMSYLDEGSTPSGSTFALRSSGKSSRFARAKEGFLFKHYFS